MIILGMYIETYSKAECFLCFSIYFSTKCLYLKT